MKSKLHCIFFQVAARSQSPKGRTESSHDQIDTDSRIAEKIADQSEKLFYYLIE